MRMKQVSSVFECSMVVGLVFTFPKGLFPLVLNLDPIWNFYLAKL